MLEQGEHLGFPVFGAGQGSKVHLHFGSDGVVHGLKPGLQAALALGGPGGIVQVRGQVAGDGVAHGAVILQSGPAAVAGGGPQGGFAVEQGVENLAVLSLVRDGAQIGLFLGGDRLLALREAHQGLRVGEGLLGGLGILWGLNAVIGEIGQVHIHALLQPHDPCGLGKLPHGVLSLVAGHGGLGVGGIRVLGHPDLIVLFDGAHVPVVFQLAFGAVEHGLVAQTLDLLQKGQGDVRPLAVGKGFLPVVQEALAVVDNGVGDGVLGNQVRNPVSLLLGLLLADGGGEEIGPHGDSGPGALLEIVAGVAVLHDHPVFGGAVAQADHGELHPGPGQGLPIDGALVFGHVNAEDNAFGFLGGPFAAAGGQREKQGRGKEQGEGTLKSIVHRIGSFSVYGMVLSYHKLARS